MSRCTGAFADTSSPASEAAVRSKAVAYRRRAGANTPWLICIKAPFVTAVKLPSSERLGTMAAIRRFGRGETDRRGWILLRCFAVALVILGLGLTSHVPADMHPSPHAHAHVEMAVQHDLTAATDGCCETDGARHGEACSTHAPCTICQPGQTAWQVPPLSSVSLDVPQPGVPEGLICDPASRPPKAV